MVGELCHLKHQGGYHCHSIKLVLTKKDVIVKSGIDDFYMDANHLPPSVIAKDWIRP